MARPEEAKKVVPPDEVFISPTNDEYALSQPADEKSTEELYVERPRGFAKDAEEEAPPAGLLDNLKRMDFAAIMADPHRSKIVLGSAIGLVLLVLVLLTFGWPWNWFAGKKVETPASPFKPVETFTATPSTQVQPPPAPPVNSKPPETPAPAKSPEPTPQGPTDSQPVKQQPPQQRL